MTLKQLQERVNSMIEAGVDSSLSVMVFNADNVTWEPASNLNVNNIHAVDTSDNEDGTELWARWFPGSPERKPRNLKEFRIITMTQTDHPIVMLDIGKLKERTQFFSVTGKLK